jgi:hypothetical protein
MKWSDYDEYLAPTHFNGKKEVTLTIREVTADEVYRQAEKRNVQTPVLWFKETKKGLVLSRTNRNALAAAFGDDAAKCIGRQIVLKLTPMRVAGRDMEVIRVHVPQSGQQQIQTQAAEALASAAAGSAFAQAEAPLAHATPQP